jgi:hypothetical protein
MPFLFSFLLFYSPTMATPEMPLEDEMLLTSPALAYTVLKTALLPRLSAVFDSQGRSLPTVVGNGESLG